MELIKFYGKKVKIVSMDGLVFLGTVGDYIYPEDNEPELESIIIESIDKELLEFYESDIESIEVIE